MTRWGLLVFSLGVSATTLGATAMVDSPLRLERTDLHFHIARAPRGATAASPAQVVFLETSGAAGPGTAWTATANQPWLDISPKSGVAPSRLAVSVRPGAVPGQPGSDVGEVRIVSAGAEALTLRVHLSIADGEGAPPHGFLDLPQGTVVVRDQPVELIGWAIDDVAITSVEICVGPAGSATLDPVCEGQAPVGQAAWLYDERPDVASIFATLPLNYRSGWRYVLEPAQFPHPLGNVRVYAVARDVEGHAEVIGTRQALIEPVVQSPLVKSLAQGARVLGPLLVLFMALQWGLRWWLRRGPVTGQTTDRGDPGRGVPASHWLEVVLVVGVLAGFLALNRPWMSRGLEYDELVTASQFVVDVPLAASATTMQVFNNHIGYSLLANVLVRFLGPSEWVLRLPALVFGAIAILAVWRLGRMLSGRFAGVLAAALLAIAPFFLTWSREARGYTGLAACSVLSSLVFLQVLRGRGTSRPWVHTAASIAGVYAHLYGLFVLAVQYAVFIAFVLKRRSKGEAVGSLRALWISFFVIGVVFAVLYLPILGQVLEISEIRGRTAFQPEFGALLFRDFVGAVAVPLGLFILALACVGAAGVKRTEAAYLISLLVVPLGVMWGLLRPSDLYTRFFLFWMPVLACLIGCAVARLGQLARSRRLIVRSIGGAALLASSLLLLMVAQAWLRNDLLPPSAEYRQYLAPALLHPERRTFMFGGDARMFTYYLGKHATLLPGSRELAAAIHGGPPVQVVYNEFDWNPPVEKQMAADLRRRCGALQRGMVTTFQCGAE